MTKAKEPAKPPKKDAKASLTQIQPGDDGAKGSNATTAGASSAAPAAGASSSPGAQDQAGVKNAPAGGTKTGKRIYKVQWRLLRNGEEYLPGSGSLALTDAEAAAIGDVLVLAQGE